MTDRDLATVLADAREEAAVLRSHGHAAQAKSMEDVCDRVAESMRAWLTTLSENEAQLRSGWSVDRLRGKFGEWAAAGFALLDGRGKRRYRECIVPPRGDRTADRLAGARGESLSRRHA